MKVTGSPLENAALAFLNQRQPALRKLGLGDLADLAAQKAVASAPTPPTKPEPVAEIGPTRPLRPGTHVDIKV